MCEARRTFHSIRINSSSCYIHLQGIKEVSSCFCKPLQVCQSSQLNCHSNCVSWREFPFDRPHNVLQCTGQDTAETRHQANAVIPLCSIQNGTLPTCARGVRCVPGNRSTSKKRSAAPASPTADVAVELRSTSSSSSLSSIASLLNFICTQETARPFNIAEQQAAEEQ